MSVNRLGRTVAEHIMGYDWPGNVRELENCMERASGTGALRRNHDRRPARQDPRAPPDRGLHRQRRPEAAAEHDVVEERYIRKVLAAVSGNKTLAAKVLGFDRRTLYRKLKQQM